MRNTTLPAIGLVGALLYSGVASAQTGHITPPNPPQLNPEDQQFIAPPMRIDSVQAPSNNIPSLNVRTLSGSIAHIFPTTQTHAQRGAVTPAADTGPLLYHVGG
jgi:hypothetical protein